MGILAIVKKLQFLTLFLIVIFTIPWFSALNTGMTDMGKKYEMTKNYKEIETNEEKGSESLNWIGEYDDITIISFLDLAHFGHDNSNFLKNIKTFISIPGDVFRPPP